MSVFITLLPKPTGSDTHATEDEVFYFADPEDYSEKKTSTAVEVAKAVGAHLQKRIDIQHIDLFVQKKWL